MAKKKQKTQKQEIKWNIINSVLAGSLVFLGACTDGNVTLNGLIAALVAGSVVAVTKFKDYWRTQEGEYRHHAFNFL